MGRLQGLYLCAILMSYPFVAWIAGVLATKQATGIAALLCSLSRPSPLAVSLSFHSLNSTSCVRYQLPSP